MCSNPRMRTARLTLAAVLALWSLPSERSPFRLVSIDPLPTAGDACAWPGAGVLETAAYAQSQAAAVALDPAPLRVIHDTAATFSAVAVDPVRDEIVLQDENLFQIHVYDRTAASSGEAAISEPKRIIEGRDTGIEFNCGLYVDPRNADIYSVANDTSDTLLIFGHDATGNARPKRTLHTPHGTYAIAVDEANGEMFLTVEHDNAIVVFRKDAKDEDKPLRLIQGDRTGLADPHGIALDTARGLIFVANHGSTHRTRADLGSQPEIPNWPLTRGYAVPGSGTLEPPSIAVYARTARGDASPLRVIGGPSTQLNWPAQMFFDQAHGELFVANDGDHSVLVFSAAATGNVAPVRVIKGRRTGLANPTGVWVDTTHDEVVVSNMGNHSATVYARKAAGDAAPLRAIRAAPAGKTALAIGNPGAVAYDSTRDELLVPN
jgi:DNA-binding beta-propeller fold protein YncE